MSHQPERPTIVDRANSTEPVRKRNTLQTKLRLYQSKQAQANNSLGGVGHPKRRKPSMPPTPWDNKS